MPASRRETSSSPAIVDFDPAEARASADAVDAKRKQGFDGAILGVPYTVKDTTWVQGRTVTNGSLLYKDFKPPRDAVAVERLKAAGGIFLGMTNTPEMAAKGHTENKVYGPSRHPMNPALTPGGSSGGAAAALAAGFTPIALGTDGGGSGRRPASHCGVVGLKTSAGRHSRALRLRRRLRPALWRDGADGPHRSPTRKSRSR